MLVTSCLDDNTVAAYNAHRLSPAEHAIVVAHLSICDDCLAIACAALQVRGSSPEQLDDIGHDAIS